MKKKSSTFQVYAKLNLEVSIPIGAESLEEAVSKATKLNVEDFVTIDGEYCDGEIRIHGVYDNQ